MNLWVPCDPRPASRPRLSRRGAFIPQADRVAKAELAQAWRSAGSPALEGLWRIELGVVVSRPPSHWLKNGGLSATGRKQVVPLGDVDNYAKLVMDGLVQCGAVEDDRQCVGLKVEKSFAGVGEPAGLMVGIRNVPLNGSIYELAGWVTRLRQRVKPEG